MQKAFSFDRESLGNVKKGLLHSFLVTLLLLAVDFVFQVAGLVHFSDPLVAAGYVYLCQNAYNIARQYLKGVKA